MEAAPTVTRIFTAHEAARRNAEDKADDSWHSRNKDSSGMAHQQQVYIKNVDADLPESDDAGNHADSES